MRRLYRLSLIAIIALFASCATTSIAFPPKKTSDDCLVLIRTTIDNKNGVPTARHYYFKLSLGYATMTAPNDTDGFMAVVIREPNVKIVELTR